MAKKTKIRSAEFKSGLFIIVAFALLIFSILWLRYFAVFPALEIKALFKDPGPIPEGMTVYYKGVNIGKVEEIGFSDDFKSTLVRINIYREGLELPSNVKAVIKTESITGNRYISLTYPENPADTLLSSGDIIEGKALPSLSDLQLFFEKQVKSGRLERIFINTDLASQKIGKLSEDVSNIVEANKDEINYLITQASDVAGNINELFGDPELQSGVKNTVRGMDKLVQETDSGFKNLFGEVEDTGLITNLNHTVKKAGCAVTRADNILAELETTDCDGNIIVKTINNTNRTVNRFDCLAKNLAKTLSKRFLFFKLFFGKPGESFNECENIQEYSRRENCPVNICPKCHKYRKPVSIPGGY